VLFRSGSWFGKRKSDALDLKLDENNQVLPPPRKPMPPDVPPEAFRETVETFYDRFALSPVL
jgi:hypothetical protein